MKMICIVKRQSAIIRLNMRRGRLEYFVTTGRLDVREGKRKTKKDNAQ